MKEGQRLIGTFFREASKRLKGFRREVPTEPEKPELPFITAIGQEESKISLQGGRIYGKDSVAGFSDVHLEVYLHALNQLGQTEVQIATNRSNLQLPFGTIFYLTSHIVTDGQIDPPDRNDRPVIKNATYVAWVVATHPHGELTHTHHLQTNRKRAEINAILKRLEFKNVRLRAETHR